MKYKLTIDSEAWGDEKNIIIEGDIMHKALHKWASNEGLKYKIFNGDFRDGEWRWISGDLFTTIDSKQDPTYFKIEDEVRLQ